MVFFKMAEDYGKRCSVETCQQLNFLPLTCTACGKLFCEQHFKTDMHQCSSVAIKDHAPERATPTSSATSSRTVPRCHVSRCKSANLMGLSAIELHCQFCGKPVCLKHRHWIDHNCSRAQETIEKERLNRQVELVQEWDLHLGSTSATTAITESQGFRSSPAWHKVLIVAIVALLLIGLVVVLVVVLLLD